MSVVREENPNEVRGRKPVTAWQLMGEGLGHPGGRQDATVGSVRRGRCALALAVLCLALAASIFVD